MASDLIVTDMDLGARLELFEDNGPHRLGTVTVCYRSRRFELGERALPLLPAWQSRPYFGRGWSAHLFRDAELALRDAVEEEDGA